MTLQQLPHFSVADIAVADVASFDPARYLSDGALNKIDKAQWKDTYSIEDVSLPFVVDNPTIKKVFKIQVSFKDSSTGKQFTKTLFFGEQDDYIFTHNNRDRLLRLSKMKNTDNPLHPNYWRVQLCLAGPDLKQNFKRVCDCMIDRRLAQLPRKTHRPSTKPMHIRDVPKPPVIIKK